MDLPKILKTKITRENIVLVGILVILLAIPLTVILLGVRQELRKRAEGVNGSILINNGAATTNSRNVTLTLAAPSQYRASLPGAGHDLFEISRAYAQEATCNYLCEVRGYLGGTCRNMNKGGCQEGEISGVITRAETTDCVLFETCCCKRPCDPSGLPDLVVDRVYYSENTIKALIKNREGGGGGATTWIWVELWVDGKKVSGTYGTGVPACLTIEWWTGREVIFADYFFAAGGTVKVCADTTNRISETNEDNNCLEVDICRECDQQCHEGGANDKCCPGFLCTRNATTGGQFRCRAPGDDPSRQIECLNDPACGCHQPPSESTTCFEPCFGSDDNCDAGLVCKSVGGSEVCRNPCCQNESTCDCSGYGGCFEEPRTCSPECDSGLADYASPSSPGWHHCVNLSCTDDSTCTCGLLTPTPTPTGAPTPTPTATPTPTPGGPTPTPTPVPTVVGMKISNDSNFSGASEGYFATTKSWTLTEGYGLKTVYAKFKWSNGAWTTPVSDSITLQTTTATPTPTPTTPPGTPTPTPAARGPTPTPTPVPVPSGCEAADLNGDGYLDIFDFVVFLGTYGQTGENLAGDLDGDGTVTILDVSIFIDLYQTCLGA